MPEFPQPAFFDLLVIGSLVLGIALAARRFRGDLRRPPPDDAPAWARENYKKRETQT